jgi:hypothetical protein
MALYIFRNGESKPQPIEVETLYVMDDRRAV